VIFGRDLWILLLSGLALVFTDFRELQPSNAGKASTFVQVMCAVGVLAGAGYGDATLLTVCDAIFWLITGLAVWSAGDYTIRGVLWCLGRRH